MTRLERAEQQRDALLELLKSTEPLPGLEKIGHKKPSRPLGRDSNIIKRDLGTAYVERRRHECGQDLSEIVATHYYSQGVLIWQRRNVHFKVNYK